MHLDDPFAYCQTYPGAWKLITRMESFKEAKDLLFVLRIEPYTIVAHAYRYNSIRCFGADADHW